MTSHTSSATTTVLVPRRHLPVAEPLAEPVPVPAARVPLASTALTVLAMLLLGFALHVGGLSHVLAARSQSLAYAELRETLANGVTPVGQTVDGALVEVGTPMALLELPGRSTPLVVLEGTAGSVLAQGPGHRRDTVLPGQAGTAVLLGRRASYGGPFGDISSLRPGRVITVTTGQGRHEYRITGVRRAGDPAPAPLAVGAGRLTLVTATGTPYLPSGTVRVDADLLTEAQPAPARALAPGAIGPEEKALAADRTVAVRMLLWSQLLLAAACAVAWARARWGHRQAWLVGVPVLAVAGTAVAHSAAQLLPNLL